MTAEKWIRAAALVAMVIVAPSGVVADPFTTMGVPLLASPYPAPAFTVPGIDGKTVSLESVRGKTVLLYFGASW